MKINPFVVALVVLIGCGGESLVRPIADGSPTPADAEWTVLFCEPGESRVCRRACEGTSEQAIGTQHCDRRGEWEGCVIEWDCPARREPPADASTPETSPPDASPEAATPELPMALPLAEIFISSEAREYRRVTLGRQSSSFGTLTARNLDPRVSEVAITVRVAPLDGARYIGSRFTGYLSPAEVGQSGDSEGMYFTLVMRPERGVATMPIDITLQDFEDAAGEFTTRDSRYRVWIQDARLTFRDGLVTRSPSVDIRFPSGMNGGNVLIRAVEAPECGSNPMPEFANQQMGNALEPSTAHLYEMDVRIHQRAGIISAGYMLLIQNESGVFLGVANPMQINLRTSTDPRASRMIDWMQCERRRGRLASMHVRFMVPRGMQFAVNGSVQIENVDDSSASILNTGGLSGTSLSSTCTYEGGTFQISRCSGDTCDDVLVLDELHSEVSDVSIRYAFGMPLVDRTCLYRSFLRR